MIARFIRRVAAPRRICHAAVAATFVFLAALAGGCREEYNPVITPVPTNPSVTPGLRFAHGETFRYTRTTIDRYGYLNPATATSVVRRVVNTQAVIQGRSGIVMILDSTVGTSATVDTLLYQMGDDGSLYAFGFLADVIHREDGRHISPSWDRLVMFGAGNRNWTVGATDTAGRMLVYGVFTGEVRYFTATVNGVSTFFQGRLAQLTGDEVRIDLWVSDQPSAFAEIVEEPMYPASGMLYELTGVDGAP